MSFSHKSKAFQLKRPVNKRGRGGFKNGERRNDRGKTLTYTRLYPMKPTDTIEPTKTIKRSLIEEIVSQDKLEISQELKMKHRS